MRRCSQKSTHLRIRLFIALLLSTAQIAPLSYSQTEAFHDIAVNGAEHAGRPLQELIMPLTGSAMLLRATRQQVESPAERAARVTHFRLCPRQIILYVGEAFTLVPMPLGTGGDVVHGAGMSWGSKHPEVAGVSSWGEVLALTPGEAVVSVNAGTGKAEVAVRVRGGGRPARVDSDYDIEHGNDCSDPESSRIDLPRQVSPEHADSMIATVALDNRMDMNTWATRRNVASFKGGLSNGRIVVKTAASTRVSALPAFQPAPILDGDSGDTSCPQAATFRNAVGSPRFSPQEATVISSTKTKKNLGSYNYLFAAPVLALGGCGIGVNLAMSYNSRVWNKDNSIMSFNYNKGWPAPGFTLGYGRIIKDYDSTATGDKSGVGSGNAPGNFLLIQPDGTQIHLQQSYTSAEGVWKHDTIDGTFLHLNFGKKLKFPDGTQVKYDDVNNRLLPTSVKTNNGDLITIAYRQRTSGFKFRWAIDYISDTLGRFIRFRYYGDSNYPADEANGKPLNALAAITAPDFAGGSSERVLVRLDYQTVTLKYNFGSMTVNAPANDLRRE